ncbi:hypothetical protein F7P69_00780 [Cellulosimicrobium funkei]|nr:hypothetical protein [Cellulosimicrobium funkei]
MAKADGRMRYGDALQEIQDALRSGGIRATLDGSKVQLPGVLIVPGVATYDRLNGEDYSATVELWLLVGDKGIVQSLNQLSDLLEQVREVYEIHEVEPLTLSLPNSGGPDGLPALRTELNLNITKE